MCKEVSRDESVANPIEPAPGEVTDDSTMAAVPSNRPRIAIYARGASDAESGNVEGSADGQVARCRNVAIRHRWDVLRVFKDLSCSGVATADRSGLTAMVAAAERGEFDLIVVEEPYRLSRDPSRLYRLLIQLSEVGVWVWASAGGMISPFELDPQPSLQQRPESTVHRAFMEALGAADLGKALSLAAR